MPDIRINRQHQLGLPAARKIALQWAEKAEEKFDMNCSYEEGDAQDTLYFTRSGIKGTLDVFPNSLDFHAQLGFLVSAFKDRIETELIEQLDKMLSDAPAKKRKSAAKKERP
ncbi:polyhydroxyalkanoic acid system family protein [Simplicispira suum]|uniref:Polyhydroxyalkanoic acid synthase n=1 Tax=Simplicispira suum TaxID=2109915 RepID=A0A2S0MZZ5_9BURK|nr:polyhydroxyalkanoic acid system family protein [Simplicispira suum]AVO41472.1 polyhydroxyalkanoic acid synthase [Simplicispira suum]MBW7833756.1 polyhydroxyalkanoic acid system family protein [Simplicispira suum]